MVIRKISVGADYKNAMNYIVGQTVLQDAYVINTIKFNGKCYEIWIQRNETDEIMKWKSYNANMPISIEYNINF